jgi:hypothetical protein
VSRSIRFTLLERQPVRIPKHLQGDSTRLGRGWGFGVYFSGTTIPGGGLMLSDLNFFEQAADARAWHRHLVSRADPSFRSLAGKAVQFDRNLVINWGNGAEVPPRRLNAIVHGCLKPGTAQASNSRTVSTSVDHSSIVLQAVGTVDAAVIERAAKIIQTRLERLGYPASQVQVRGSRIVIDFSGPLPPARAQKAAESPGLLEFYDLETSLTGLRSARRATRSRRTTCTGYSRGSKAQARSAPTGYYLFSPRHGRFFGPAPTRAAALALAGKHRAPKGWRFLPVPHDTVVTTCDSTEVVCPGNLPQQGNAFAPPPRGRSYYYLFSHDPNKVAVRDIRGSRN